jgi:hypothetical protein
LFNNLYHTGAGTLQLINNDLDINGDFQNTAGTFDQNSRAISIAGTWSNNAAATFTSGTGTVTFDGAGVQTLDTGGTGVGKAFYNLIYSGTGTLRPINNDITIGNNLTLNAGAGIFDNATADCSITITGNVTMDNTTTSLGDGTWTVGGNWDSDGLTTLTPNNSLIVFTGAGKTCVFNNSYPQRPNIRIDNLASVSTTATFVVGDLDVRGTLTIPGGVRFQSIDAANNISISGNITGAGDFEVVRTTIGTMTGTIDCASFEFYGGANDSLPAAQYDSAYNDFWYF